MDAKVSSSSLERLLRDRGVCESGAVGAFRTYLFLLERWNERINITASTDWEGVGPLFEEAIWAAELYPVGESIHLDIGSGGGFPAVPIRILRPRMRLSLVESRIKRSVFLQTVVHELGLKGTAVENQRVDSFLEGAGQAGLWQIVSWKGVKLGRREVGLLLERSREDVQFWLFHGKGLPVADLMGWEKSTKLIRRETCPSRPGSFLSIFEKSRRRAREA